MAGFRIEGNTSGNVVEVDTNNNIKANLPTTNTQSGFVRLTYLPTSTVSKDALITEEGAQSVVAKSIIADYKFNSASTAWSGKFGTTATTLTKAVTNGFMVLNSAAATTTTTGISLYSNRTFNIQEGAEVRLKVYLKHLNAAATNKQIDVGFGYYAFAAGQAAAMNEFIGFRWTTTGGLQAVLETSQGGAPTSQTVNVNSNVPYSDNVAREYEISVTESAVEYWVAGTFVARITFDPGSYAIIKGISLPFIARVFNSGTASAGATLSVGSITVFRYNTDNQPYSALQASMDNNSYYAQPDLIAAATATHSFPTSGTAPTAAVGSNTASAANNTAVMGGIIRNTLTGVTITLSSNILWTGYQNPAVPTVAGVATNSRNFYVTGISISPMVVTTALTGGGFTAGWFAAIGNTAVSLATTDADGTTAVAQKAPRYVPLSLVSTLAATAALGVVSTDVGDHQFIFPTPLVVHPGEFLSIGMRTIAVTAAITVGSADCLIGINGYWE